MTRNLYSIVFITLFSATFFIQTAQAQEEAAFSEGDTTIVSDSLRYERIKSIFQSFLQEIPEDSIRPYCKNAFFQGIVTLRSHPKNSQAEKFLMVETGSAYINETFRERILNSNELDYLFVTQKKEDRVSGPFLFTYLVNDEGNILTTTKEQRENEPDLLLFYDITDPPIFPGCEEVASDNEATKMCFQKKMQNHIATNFKYPKKLLAMGLDGNTQVSFMITQKGIVKITKTTGTHSLFVKEAERIIRLLPKFKPGAYKGLDVDTLFSIPINFRLN